MNYSENPILITGCARSVQSGIYEIRNIITNKKYIGSAINLKERFRLHKVRLKLDRHSNRYLQSAWNKYEEKAFRFKCLLYCDKKHLFFLRTKIFRYL